MPPELAQSQKSKASLPAHLSFDIWSLGISLFRMLTSGDFFHSDDEALMFLSMNTALDTYVSSRLQQTLGSGGAPQSGEQEIHLLTDMLKSDASARPNCEALLGRAFFRGGATVNMARLQSKLGKMDAKLDHIGTFSGGSFEDILDGGVLLLSAALVHSIVTSLSTGGFFVALAFLS